MPEEKGTGQQAAGTTQKVSALVEQWLDGHQGEDFDLDVICRQLDIRQRDNKHAVTQKLARLVAAGEMDKRGRTYHSVDKNLKRIDWVNASAQEYLPLHWPFGRGDDTHFCYDGHVFISPGDLIVLAGVSNMGKTLWCLNFLWENMDNFPCTLMGNEYQPSKFKRRVSFLDWANPLNDHGGSKFELIERYDGWKDAIQPDNINIIDWINLDDKFYMIGAILQGIRSKLRKGIAVICLQKNPNKTLGTGGDFSKHLSSLYLVLDYERMTVEKAKEWDGTNPNGMIDRFKIVDHGSKFHDIHRIVLCPQCRGYAAIKKNPKCQCRGEGYIDYESEANARLT